MASSREYLEFILGQLSDVDEITYRAMMGEFIIYYRGKIVGGIYDDRLLVKPVKSAISYMPTAPYEFPYEELLIGKLKRSTSVYYNKSIKIKSRRIFMTDVIEILRDFPYLFYAILCFF